MGAAVLALALPLLVTPKAKTIPKVAAITMITTTKAAVDADRTMEPDTDKTVETDKRVLHQ